MFWYVLPLAAPLFAAVLTAFQRRAGVGLLWLPVLLCGLAAVLLASHVMFAPEDIGPPKHGFVYYHRVHPTATAAVLTIAFAVAALVAAALAPLRSRAASWILIAQFWAMLAGGLQLYAVHLDEFHALMTDGRAMPWRATLESAGALLLKLSLLPIPAAVIVALRAYLRRAKSR